MKDIQKVFFPLGLFGLLSYFLNFPNFRNANRLHSSEERRVNFNT